MRVIELRNYLLKDGVTGDFIRYFEEHFLFAQREEGMHVLGQFEVVDEPNRFTWIRGFENMQTRLRGLSGFGPSTWGGLDTARAGRPEFPQPGTYSNHRPRSMKRGEESP